VLTRCASGEREDAAPDAREAAKKADAVERESMQVDRMAAFGAGDMRLARKLRSERGFIASLQQQVHAVAEFGHGLVQDFAGRTRGHHEENF
jgi:hypothetical protein